MRWGVALGGGGLPGVAAHLGVMRALEEAGLSPDVVLGASAGGLVAGALAAGMGLTGQIAAWEAIAADPYPTLPREALHLLEFFQPSPAPGLLSLSTVVARVLREARFLRLPAWRPGFGVMVSDLTEGLSSLLSNVPAAAGPAREWSAGDALVATAAFPVLFSGVRGPNGHLYADGGVYDLVPVDACRRLGCERVVAVRIGVPQGVPPTLSLDALLHLVARRLLDATDADANPHPADLEIRVATTGGLLSLADFRTDVATGLRAGQAETASIDALLRG